MSMPIGSVKSLGREILVAGGVRLGVVSQNCCGRSEAAFLHDAASACAVGTWLVTSEQSPSRVANNVPSSIPHWKPRFCTCAVCRCATGCYVLHVITFAAHVRASTQLNKTARAVVGRSPDQPTEATVGLPSNMAGGDLRSNMWDGQETVPQQLWRLAAALAVRWS